MTRLNTNVTTISDPLMPKYTTSAADDEMFASSELERNRQAWQEIIDRKLIDWGRSPGLIDEDGIVSPSFKSVTEAIKLVYIMANKGFPIPLRVVCNADGGIEFEWKEGPVFNTIEFFEDGSKEYCQFVNSRLLHREIL